VSPRAQLVVQVSINDCVSVDLGIDHSGAIANNELVVGVPNSTSENHLRFAEKVRVCQKRSPGDAGGPTRNRPSVLSRQLSAGRMPFPSPNQQRDCQSTRKALMHSSMKNTQNVNVRFVRNKEVVRGRCAEVTRDCRRLTGEMERVFFPVGRRCNAQAHISVGAGGGGGQ